MVGGLPQGTPCGSPQPRLPTRLHARPRTLPHHCTMQQHGAGAAQACRSSTATRAPMAPSYHACGPRDTARPTASRHVRPWAASWPWRARRLDAGPLLDPRSSLARLSDPGNRVGQALATPSRSALHPGPQAHWATPWHGRAETRCKGPRTKPRLASSAPRPSCRCCPAADLPRAHPSPAISPPPRHRPKGPNASGPHDAPPLTLAPGPPGPAYPYPASMNRVSRLRPTGPQPAAAP